MSDAPGGDATGPLVASMWWYAATVLAPARALKRRGVTVVAPASGDELVPLPRPGLGPRFSQEWPEPVLLDRPTEHDHLVAEFDRARIVQLVRAKEAEGWSFVFMGADLDAYGEAAGLGYDARSVQSFAPDGTGADLAFASLSQKTTAFRDKVRDGINFDQGDFFEDDKPAEADRTRRHDS